MARKMIDVSGWDLGVAREENGTITIVVLGNDAEGNDIVTYLNAEPKRVKQWISLIEEHMKPSKKGVQ